MVPMRAIHDQHDPGITCHHLGANIESVTIMAIDLLHQPLSMLKADLRYVILRKIPLTIPHQYPF